MFLKKTFSFDVLNKLNKYPLDLDGTTFSYYEKIKNVINVEYNVGTKELADSYYIQKRKTLLINGEKFYEYTLTSAFDSVSKFNRFIAYSKIKIFGHYAIKCCLCTREIVVFERKINISIIQNYWVSIRPCEIEKFGRLFGCSRKITRTEQYDKLMEYIQNNEITLSKIFKFDKETYYNFKIFVTGNKNLKTALLEILDIARDVFLTAGPGTNVLTYLAAFMNNTVLEDQLDFAPNELFSNLFIKNKDQFFDKTPFSASLSNHNPLFSILIDEFDPNEYEDDLFARSIKFNSNNEGVIYTKFKSEDFDDVDDLISKYNIRLKYPTSYRRLIRDGSNVYVKEDEENSEMVIREILKLQSTVNFADYANYISSALSSCGFTIDDQDKEDAIRKMFSCSSVYCVYGAAGTGKTTLISHELKLINSTSKLCLANTHPAVENLKRRINDNSCTFATISKVLHESFDKNDFEIVVIDECSNISTRDMSNFLKKIRFKLLILSGDIYQLPSIEFGNWFALLRHFLDKNSYSDLHHPFRNEDEYLLTIWNKVRNLDSTIIEALDTFRICSEINDEILSKPLKDEIILTLNYDGLYGINNLNRILQLGNDQPPVVWKHYTFKVGDPIIFNENCDYGGYIYNNLKGELAKIDINENGDIVFDIIIDITLSSLKNYEYYGFKLLKVLPENKSLVEITVKNSSEKDFDQDTRAMRKVPFQIAYAISIHKAQGLEYNNVKVVITNEIDESITHNVFYTAITRAKKVLKIYWSPESQNKIIKNFEISNCSTDAHILSNKYNFKLVKLK